MNNVKKYCTFYLILLFSFYYSQQTEGLRIIKNKYASEFEKIENASQSSIIQKLSKKQLNEFIVKKNAAISVLELKRNNEYLEELTRMKLYESTHKSDIPSVKKLDEKREIVAEYSKGINQFKQEILDNFYAGTINADGKISCIVNFIFDKDGSIVEVKGVGDNEDFNKQAELAVYLSDGTWEPARIDGYTVRYRMRLPLTIQF
ncbi:energy transducer TonB [Chryseobacterium sp. LAM-KRS1]|uniref:energy transducer TonB n=1 Tax=Chryseobacterium sp. LAM-KRS1 TaxID=2715754 RepID=UPI0015579047|nr:hypothetical protein [Chryseobacterium sp. LAM-KRS1]